MILDLYFWVLSSNKWFWLEIWPFIMVFGIFHLIKIWQPSNVEESKFVYENVLSVQGF